MQLLSRTFGRLRRRNRMCAKLKIYYWMCSALSHQFISSHHHQYWNETKLRTQIDSQCWLHVIFSAVVCLWWSYEMWNVKKSQSLMLYAHSMCQIRNSHWTNYKSVVKVHRETHKTKITRFAGQFGVKLFHKYRWVNEHTCIRINTHTHSHRHTHTCAARIRLFWSTAKSLFWPKLIKKKILLRKRKKNTLKQ